MAPNQIQINSPQISQISADFRRKKNPSLICVNRDQRESADKNPLRARRRHTQVCRDVDGIATHCGYIEPKNLFGSMAAVSRACDKFFAKRGKIWCGTMLEYVSPHEIRLFQLALGIRSSQPSVLSV